MGATNSIFLARLILSLTAPIVPRQQREDWHAEWSAELAAEAERPRHSRDDTRRSLLRHALGAPVDALWMRQRAIADLKFADDLRVGWRQLRQQAGFGLTAIGILALGMSASITAFSVVTQLLLRPLPYPEPDRIVTLWQRHADSQTPLDVAPGNFLDWRDRASSFSHLAGAEPYSHDYIGGDRPEVLPSILVTEGFFEAFGLSPLAGRYFRPEEHRKGANRVAVISARLWRSLFGADPSLVGRAIALDDGAYTVVGIAPDDFQTDLFESGSGHRGLWLPKAIEDHEIRIRAGGYWNVVGRLSQGRSLEDARAEMDAIATQIEAEQPRTNRNSRVAVLSFREHLVGDVRPAVTLFAWAVAAVLLIACVNVTNLLLARAISRQPELAIRTALGANRRRLVNQLLAESLLLSTLAGAVALALSAGAVRLIRLLGPRDVLWIDTLHLDGAAGIFTTALCGLVALLAGTVPALRATAAGLQASGARTATGGRSHRRLRSGLVAAEVAMALVLVSGCGLLLRSFVNLLNVDAGFQTRGVAALQIFAWDRNPDAAARRTYFERVLDGLSSLPGVEAVGAVTAMPFIESNIDIQGVFRVVGRPAPAPGEEPRSSFNVATPGYFAAMRIRLVRGRHLDARDGPDAPRVAVISDALAAKYWRDDDPIGDRVAFRSSGQPIEAEIVGVTGSTRHDGLDQQPRMELFLPHAQAPSGSMTLVARTSLDPRMLIEPAKAAVWEIDPRQTFYRTATLDELVGRTLVTRRFALVVLTGFALLALLLAAAGLYGVLSSIASQYRREIGVRLALGARWADIVRLLLARGLAVATTGVAVGLIAVAGGARLLRSFLFSVAPTDPLALSGAALVMLLVAGFACYLPARRAAAADPVEVLRAE
jgi:putative ABC transport system permease protein